MARARPPAQPLPEEDQPAGQRHRDRDEEEEEPRGEGLVRVDADVAEEADEERLSHGEAVERERDEQDEEEERPHHVVDPRRELDPHRTGGRPDREHAHGLDRDREEEERDQESRPVAECVDTVVDGANGALEPKRAQQRRRRAEQRPGRTREEEEGEEDRPDHERAFDPEVGADVVAAEREQEPERAEQDRRSAAERTLEQHDRGDRAEPRRVAPRGLEDPHGIAADRGRQDLPRRVRDEVGARQPRQALAHPLRGQQPPPALGHRDHRQRHDRDREQEPPRARVRDHLGRLTDVDLPDEVGDREGGEEQRRRDAEPTAHAWAASRIRPRASITSAMSPSECAGESGSERISSPARSATGSDGCPGKRSRYQVSRCTGRKWIEVEIRSAARAC